MNNRVRFEVRRSDQSYASEVGISIDGRDLIHLVREIEVPFAAAEGTPHVAGAYAGLPFDGEPLVRHFLGQSDEVYEQDGKVAVLGCECGEPGCRPLLARIETDEGSVVWSDFEQPDRVGGGILKAWRYDNLGPFRFDRAEYESALGALS